MKDTFSRELCSSFCFLSSDCFFRISFNEYVGTNEVSDIQESCEVAFFSTHASSSDDELLLLEDSLLLDVV